MKAVFLDKPGGSLVVRETETPVPDRGEVLVKIAAAPVNPSDISRIRNVTADDAASFIPGLEGSGTVVAAGKGILPSLWKGRRVACSAAGSSGGTWAEYMVTAAAKCFPLNSKVSDEQGSMTLVNPLTALAFIDLATGGKHKAVINNAAASALGRMLEMLCRKKRLPLINIVRNRDQAHNLKKLGSEYVLDSSDPLFPLALKALSEKLGATLLFDSVGGTQFSVLTEALPHGSTVIIYGSLSPDEFVRINPRKLLANDLRISGFYLGNHAAKNGLIRNILDLRKVTSLMAAGMTVKIRDRFPIEKAQLAVESYLENMSAGKVLLLP